MARGRQDPNAFCAISPCVTDDRAGGRRVPPNTSAASPFTQLDQLLRRLGDPHAETWSTIVTHPRLTLVREPGSAPIGGGIPQARVFELYERHVAGAVRALEPPERRCIELAYVEGLEVDEIAGRCGMSQAAVDDRLRRGLNDMLRYLRACARREAPTGAAEGP